MSNLNNDKNVYILGAGFSKEIGLPLQDDFLLVAKEVYFRDPTKYKHFERVFEYQNSLSKMRNFLSYPLLNLEHLFNLLEMDIYYSGDEKVRELKTDFLKLIKDVLVELTPNPFHLDSSRRVTRKPEYNNYLSFLEMFIKGIGPRRIEIHNDTIISFNYDLVFEATTCLYNWKKVNSQGGNFDGPGLIRLNTEFGDKIVNKNLSGYFTGGIGENCFATTSTYNSSEQAIKLIKLHGSINWQEPPSKESFIIPPTWNKSDEKISKLWSLAYRELKEAKRIIIIGYSFPETDTYVKSLLALAFNENKILQNIYFINPDTEQVKSRCLDLLDNHFEKYCDYKDWTFSEFVNSENFIETQLNRKQSQRNKVLI